MSKDFIKGIAVGMGIAGLAAAAAAVAVKAIKGCCCCCDDGDFEYECCCGDCEDDPDYMDAPVGDHCCEASEENGTSEEEENSEE